MAVIATGAITITDLNDGHSGGRNYIRNSDDMINDNYHGIVNAEDHPNAAFAGVAAEVPDGSEDSVLQLDNFNGASYRLGVLPHVEGGYVYTVWAKALTDMTLNINMLGSTTAVPLTVEDGWQKIEIANASPTTDSIEISPVYAGSGADGDLLMYRSMLELGDVASDWSPAPEDSEEEAMRLSERITSAEEEITETAIINKVLRNETYQNNLSELRTSISSTATQLEDSFTLEFNNMRQAIDTADKNFNDYVEEVRVYQRFDSDGIHMGKSDSPFTMDLSNQELAFKDNGNTVASISNQALQITEAVVQTRFMIGKFAFIPTDTGMALIYVGNQN